MKNKNKIKFGLFSLFTTFSLVFQLVLPSLFLFPRQASAQNWWDSNWQYRREIIIDHTANSNTLSEYQILVSLNSSNFDFSKTKSDGSDLRFIDSDNSTLLDFWIVYFHSSSKEAKIWVKIPHLSAFSTKTIYLYYGNPSASALSNIEATFSYSVPRTVGYVVSSRLASGNLDIISLADGNQITNGISSLNLDNQQTGTFSSGELSLGTAIQAKKLFQADSSVQATDIISPVSWAGKEFYYYSMRGTNQFAMVSPFGNAQVKIYDNGTQVWSGTVDQNGRVVNQDIANYHVVRVSSDLPILVQHYASSQLYDSIVYYPAADDYLYGVPSNYLQIGSGSQGSNVSWIKSDGNTGSVSLGNNGGYSLGGQGSSGSAPAFRIKGSEKIGVNQLADHDGTEGTTFLPYQELGTTFGSQKSAEYIAVAVPEANTTCTLYNNTGNEVAQQISGTRNDVNKIGFGTGSDSQFISGGWKMICDRPVYAYFEEDIKGDETNLLSWPQMRQYTYPEPSVTLGNEEKIPSPFALVALGATEYKSGEIAHLVIQITDQSTGQPVNNASALIDIWDPSNNQLVNDDQMTYLSGSDGLYYYDFTTPNTEGVYTYSCQATYNGQTAYTAHTFHVAPWANRIESIWNKLQNLVSDIWNSSFRTLTSFGTLVADIWNYSSRKLTSREIESGGKIASEETVTNYENYKADISDLAKSAEIEEIKTLSGEIKDKLELTQSELADLKEKINDLEKDINDLLQSSNQEDIYTKLESISDQISDLGNIIDLSGLEELIKVSKDDLNRSQDIQNKLIELKSIIEINKSLLETGISKPLAKVIYEWGSIILKVIATNPTNEENEITVKTALPKEVTPEEIIKKDDDLEIKYNPEKDLYFAYFKVKLAPQESVIKEIEVRDIWTIPEEVIRSLENQAKKSADLLKHTLYSSRANILKKDIVSKLDYILNEQRKTDILPEDHIISYRKNSQILGTVKQNVKSLENLVISYNTSRIIFWKILIILISGLILLGLLILSILKSQKKISSRQMDVDYELIKDIRVRENNNKISDIHPLSK